MRKTIFTTAIVLGAIVWFRPEAIAQTHCRGLGQEACAQAVACKWIAAKEGGMNKSPRRAYCRLDTKAASDAIKGQSPKGK